MWYRYNIDNNTMDVIINKIKNTKQLYEQLSNYTREIPRFNKSKIGTDINDDMKIIENIFSQLDMIIKKNNSLSINDIFKVWGMINEIVYIIKLILTNLETVAIRHQKIFVEDITENDVEKINNLYSNIIVFYNKYKKRTIQIDIDSIYAMFNNIQSQLKWTKENAIENTDILTEIVKKIPHSVSLYTYIIQQNINTCLSFGSEICDYILNQVENVKDYIILYEKKVHKGKKDLFVSNPNLQTFGLTPSGESATLKDITQKLFNTPISNVSKLESLAKKEKFCIVVINQIIKNPIEFNLWKLIDKDLAQSYKQTSDMGITQKTIDKFDTIVFKKLGKGKKWNFNIDQYGSIDSDNFVILSNLSNDLYRLYSIYNEMPIIGGGQQETKINKSKIIEFIEYVKNKGIINTHTRISEYNDIQEKKILDNMFLPVKFNIHGIKLNSQLIDSKFLRHELLLQLIKQFDDIIKKEYKNGEKIQTLKDIAQIIHSEKLIDVFNSILIEQYDIYAIKNKEHSSDFPFSETLQTFLAVLFNMNIDFRRLLHDYYIKTKIDKKLLSENEISKQLKLRNIFKEIIDQVLKKIINDERNIYQELVFKNSLLKLSLY